MATKTTPAQHLASHLDTICGPTATLFGLPAGERPTVSRVAVAGRRGGAFQAHATRSSTIGGDILGYSAEDAIAEINRRLIGAR